MANNSLRIDNSLSFKPLASAPSDPRPGQLYVDSADDNKLKQYVDNVGWVAIGDVQGLAGSDWTAFTPTGSFTNTTYTGLYRRVGDSAEIQVKGVLTGTPASTTLTVDLPSGLTIDTSKLVWTDAVRQQVGMASILDDGTAQYFGTVQYKSPTSVEVAVDQISSVYLRYSGGANDAVPMTWAAPDTFAITFTVPIVGWSSNLTIVSDPAATPSAISYYLSANQAVTANVTDIAFDTVISDPKSLYSAGVFTADVAGTYSIITSGSTTTGSIAPILYKNGVATAYLSNWDQVSVKTSAVTVQLAVGDTLSIRSNTTDTIYGQTLDNGGSTLSIARLTGSTSLALDNTRQTLTMGVSATPPGYGSSGTATMRFDVTIESQGSEITYVDSATDGGKIVVSAAGVYAIGGATYNADGSTRAFGIAYNSTDLTVSGGSIPITERVASFDNLPGGTASTGDTVILEAGSYITMQCDPSSGTGGSAYTFLRVTKIASIV